MPPAARDLVDSWSPIVDGTARFLSQCDDRLLWALAIAEIFRDAEYLCGQCRLKSRLFAEVGACSHWQRPHQHRWLKDGSFAAPYGYSGTGFNIHAWPEFEWSLLFRWDRDQSCWIPVDRVSGKRPLRLRVTLPTRSATHKQAAVHTIWTPGSPTVPDREALQLYGFRKIDNQWRCTAASG
jgi:hypothetical protein